MALLRKSHGFTRWHWLTVLWSMSVMAFLFIGEWLGLYSMLTVFLVYILLLVSIHIIRKKYDVFLPRVFRHKDNGTKKVEKGIRHEETQRYLYKQKSKKFYIILALIISGSVISIIGAYLLDKRVDLFPLPRNLAIIGITVIGYGFYKLLRS